VNTTNTTNTRRLTVLRRGVLSAVAIGALTLAAGCGSDSDSSTKAGDSSGSAEMTVSIRDADGGQVLATSEGRTLYVSDQEKGNALCVSSACMAIWTPLTVSSGNQPSAPAELSEELSTLKRPDGSSQVALGGQPLYTFSFDRNPGQVNGDGQSDSFDGVDFTWHAAKPSGETPATPSESTDPSSPSDDGGGYGY
jgi:predicted lipoprotein with Yx(FWY)xxD motif